MESNIFEDILSTFSLKLQRIFKDTQTLKTSWFYDENVFSVSSFSIEIIFTSLFSKTVNLLFVYTNCLIYQNTRIISSSIILYLLRHFVL